MTNPAVASQKEKNLADPPCIFHEKTSYWRKGVVDLLNVYQNLHESFSHSMNLSYIIMAVLLLLAVIALVIALAGSSSLGFFAFTFCFLVALICSIGFLVSLLLPLLLDPAALH